MVLVEMNYKLEKFWNQEMEKLGATIDLNEL